MSNRSRLILLSGTTRGLATSLAQSTAHDAGVEVWCDDAAPLHPTLATALHGAVSVLSPATVPASLWESLLPVRPLSVLLAAADTVRQGGVAVVDAGDLVAAGTLVTLPGQVVRLLDGLLTPSVAAAGGLGGAAALAALVPLRDALVDVDAVLHDTVTTMRLACRPGDGATVLAAARTLTMLGVIVDGIAVVRRKNERDQAAETARRLARRGVAAWTTGRRMRPAPRGCDAVATQDHPPVLRSADLRVEHVDAGYRLTIPAPVDAVGLEGDALVIRVAGHLRWLPLPAALARCHAHAAARRGAGVEIDFAPDADRWPVTA